MADSSTLISLVGALGVGGWLGALISSWLTNRRDAAERTAQFRKQQLGEFYGPLLSLHKEILARSELRVKIQEATDRLHIEDMLNAGPDGVEAASDTHVPGILQTIRDENTTLREVLMPRYREMISVFREKMWLADPQTRAYFPALVEFVDVWDKILTDRLPASVAPAIGHSEGNLKPFYEHLERMHDRIRSEIVV
jgi:hypothetical protein